MEKSKKIKEGILKFINQGNLKEADDILVKYEKAQPEDPDIYNLKSMINTGKNELDKAQEILIEGREKHPRNFDIVFNLAFLMEQQEKPLHAIDLYLEGNYITVERNEKQETIEAIERIQEKLKVRVDQIISDNTIETSTINQLELDRVKSTEVLDVNIEKCVNPYNFNFGKNGWNPYVATIEEWVQEPETEYVGSKLNSFYSLFRPNNLQEALFGKEQSKIHPINVSWGPFPWGEYNFQDKLSEIKQNKHPYFGICTDKAGKSTRRKLINHYKLLRETKYHPDIFEDDYIKGYLLKSKKDYRFIVCQGNHQVAALASLGYNTIRCHLLDDKKSLKIVDVQDINKWPLVKNKTYSRETAKKVFYSFFENNGRERAIESDQLCDNLDPEKAEELRKLGVNLKKTSNVKLYNAGLLNKIDEVFVNEVKEYWKAHYDIEIDPGFHIAFLNHTGKKEVKVIPQHLIRRELNPFFTDIKKQNAYDDKNIYDIILGKENTPKTLLKRVRGNYFGVENEDINKGKAIEIFNLAGQDLILKNSLSDDGKDIFKLTSKNGGVYLGNHRINLSDIEKKMGKNFIIQEVIKQHEIMAKPHPSSINTLRMVTVRWKGKIYYLQSFARFGANNDIRDNAGVGGLCLGVGDDGKFFQKAVDKRGKEHKQHPSTGYVFKDLKAIPEFNKFIEFVKEAHKRVIHQNFVSWDIAVGVDGEPIIIEMNFWGAVWLYQLATEKPIFGELTEEILEHIRDERKKEVKY